MRPLISTLLFVLIQSVFATVPEYGQCGGLTYSGETECDPGLTCFYESPYFSNCFLITTTSTSPTSTSTTTTTTTTTVAATTVVTAPEWGQCGGDGYIGPTVCPAGWVCYYNNAYHSQCLPGSTTSTTSTSDRSTSKTTSTSASSISTKTSRASSTSSTTRHTSTSTRTRRASSTSTRTSHASSNSVTTTAAVS